MLFAENDHAANAPETWKIVHIPAGRRWELQTKDGGVLVSHPTKKACEADKVSGFFVDLYAKEGRWFAGEQIPNWKPYVRATPTPETPDYAARLESLRAAIRAENISYGEIAELQSLAQYIDPSDVELLEWAGVPEQYTDVELTLVCINRGTDDEGEPVSNFDIMRGDVVIAHLQSTLSDVVAFRTTALVGETTRSVCGLWLRP